MDHRKKSGLTKPVRVFRKKIVGLRAFCIQQEADKKLDMRDRCGAMPDEIIPLAEQSPSKDSTYRDHD
jgi:hypothetical protein